MKKSSGFPDWVGVVLYLIFAAPIWVLAGFTVSTLWGWFVVPLGVVAIGKANAAGLVLIIGYIRAKNTDDDEPFTEGIAKGIVFSVTISGLALGVGAIIYWFMP